MSQIRRFAFAMKVTLAMGLAAIIHFRVGVEQVYPLGTGDFSGPFSGIINIIEFTVPLTIAIIVIATWVWVLISPVQEERTVRRVRR